MTGRATVISVDGDTAVVQAVRSSACEGCHKKDADGKCSVCTLLGGERVISARAYNKAGASVGDSVNIESRSDRMIWYAALVFIIPILVGLIAYFFAGAFTDNELYLSLAALGGFAAAFIFAAIYSSVVARKRCDVTVTAIINKSQSGGNGDITIVK